MSVGSTRNPRPCPACGGVSAEERIVVGKKDLRGEPLRLATCAGCGVTYQPAAPTAETLATWYDYMGRVDEPERPPPVLEHRIHRILDRFEPYRRTGKLLDVGCGRGAITLVAADRGWAVSATEISSSCVARLRRLLGPRLHEGSLHDAPFEVGTFDVVLMVEVLEHLDEPASYLRRARELLRPGGLLFVTTPNFRGISGRLLDGRWRVIADEHLTYYDRTSLARFLKACGFVGVRVVTSGIDIGPIVSWLRGVGASSPPEPHGPDIGETARTGGRAVAPMLVDRAVTLANGFVRLFGIGDGIKAWAERP